MSRARRKSRHTFARYAAPLAFLLAVTIAVLLIRSGLKGGADPQTTTRGPVTRTATTLATTTRRSSTSARQFYPVSISAKAAISIEELRRLNPGVSSNSLQVGQKVRVK